MTHRLFVRALLPVAALTVIGAIGLTPALSSSAKPPASSATWQINSVVGDPASFTQFTTAAASGPDNAWVGGFACTDSSCTSHTAVIQQWNGQSWQTVNLPDTNVGASGLGLAIATSSASDSWIFASDASDTGYGVHVTESGTTQTAMPADGNLRFMGAATFSPDDAWAFGFTGDFFNADFLAYAAHFDGQTWTQLPTPPVIPRSVSALSADDLWIMGETSFNAGGWAVAHWTGDGWSTMPLPTAAELHLPTGHGIAPTGILALNLDDIWVTANQAANGGVFPGALLLHWNGKKWQSAATPGASVLAQVDFDIAADGNGGFWVSGYGTTLAPNLYHFSKKRWTEQPAPTQTGLTAQFGSLAWIPGTTSLWGAAALNDAPDNTVLASQGVIYQYNQ